MGVGADRCLNRAADLINEHSPGAPGGLSPDDCSCGLALSRATRFLRRRTARRSWLHLTSALPRPRSAAPRSDRHHGEPTRTWDWRTATRMAVLDVRSGLRCVMVGFG